jgi:FG-GAP-like repeat
MQPHRTRLIAPAILLVACGMQHASADDSPIFENPVRLEADGKIIDTGDKLGHSGPTMADVDGDGVPDLVVGDFSGQFRVYRNLARTGLPRLGPMSYLMAGGVRAKVPIYCCIGSSPLFADFDGDGRLDLLSGSYDPGACYLFRGLGNGQFAARETLVDKHNKPLLRDPRQQQAFQSFGSWPALVDWDHDGDLDLLVGGFDGTIHVFLNEGTRKAPQFAGTNFTVQADGKELKVPGHAAPVVVDWDGDGRWDILCGCEAGSVYFFRNIGMPAAPKFAAPVTIVEKHHGTGYSEFGDLDQPAIPGIRSQIAAVDYDRDGRVDLLLGDFCTTLTPKAGLTAAQRSEMTAIFQRQAEIAKARKAIFAALVAEFKKKYPGDLGLSKEGNAWWNKAYVRTQKSQESEDLKRESANLESKLTPVIETPPTQRWLDGPETCHGYVWFYRRKPDAASPAAIPLATTTKAAPSDSPEEPTEREPVVASLSIEPIRAKPGDIVTATVTVKLARDWHINPVANLREFASPTKLELTLPDGTATAGAWDIRKPDIGLVDSGPVYTGEVRFTRSLKVDTSAQSGKLELVCKLSYQACDEHRCLRPTSKTLRVPLEIEAK